MVLSVPRGPLVVPGLLARMASQAKTVVMEMWGLPAVPACVAKRARLAGLDRKATEERQVLRALKAYAARMEDLAPKETVVTWASKVRPA